MNNAETSQKLIALLRSLRAVRQFRPDPVPQEVVDAVLEVARWSGSASNHQPWETEQGLDFLRECVLT